MYIIFGKQTAEQMAQKYTVLELDLIQLEPNGPVLDTYCVLEGVPLTELPELERYQHLHSKLIENYRKRNWSFCEQALEHLHGRWGSTVNSFYDEISKRIARYKEQDPGTEWNGVYEKFTNNT